MGNREPKIFNGPALVVAMLREIDDPVFKKQLTAKISEQMPMLARLAEFSEFVYSDVRRLDDRSLQIAMAQIPEKEWLVAWKLTDDHQREVILGNMSDRKKEDFLHNFKKLPRMSKKEVMRVQHEIAQKIHQLLQSGKLKIKSRRRLDELKYRQEFLKKRNVV